MKRFDGGQFALNTARRRRYSKNGLPFPFYICRSDIMRASHFIKVVLTLGSSYELVEYLNEGHWKTLSGIRNADLVIPEGENEVSELITKSIRLPFPFHLFIS